MKPPPHRNPKPRHRSGPSHAAGSAIARRPSRTNTPDHHLTTARFPRYPSLSDDHYPPIISARLIAALIFLAIIIALVVGA